MNKGRLFRIICGFMMAFIVGILVVLFVSDDDASAEVSVDLNEPYSDTANWMASIGDDKYISEITIPGTHNTCARNVVFGYSMRCQKTDVYEQLENGFRYLDMRIAVDDSQDREAIKLVHKFASCHDSGSVFSNYLYLTDVTADLYKFLQKHPTETVIVNFKIEDDTHKTADIQDMLLKEITTNKDYWYTGSEIPTMSQARGRAVLATRFDDEAKSGITGLNMIWSEQDNTIPADIPYELNVSDDFKFWVQDRYKYSVEDKYQAVVEGLENCEVDEETLFLNFVSTSGDGKIGHPYGYAKTLNNMLMEYPLKNETCYGTIIVDFGTPNLARHIYYSNF